MFYAKWKTIVSNLQTITAHLAVIDGRFETSVRLACDSKRHEILLSENNFVIDLLPITFRSVSAGLERPRGSRPRPTRPRPRPTRPRPRPQPTRPRPGFRPRGRGQASRPNIPDDFLTNFYRHFLACTVSKIFDFKLFRFDLELWPLEVIWGQIFLTIRKPIHDFLSNFHWPVLFLRYIRLQTYQGLTFDPL